MFFRDVIMQVLDVTLTTRSFRFRRPQMLTNEHDQKQYNAVNTSIPTSKKNGSEGGKKKHRNSPKESKLRHSDSTPRCSATEPQIIRFVNPSSPESDSHLISLYNISSESNIRVMRIKEMITNVRYS